MEKIGQVNRYVCRDCRRQTFTVNLDSGTTPFGVTCPHCGKIDCFSNSYRVGPLAHQEPVTVTHGFYRPTPERLAELNAELRTAFPGAGPDGWDDHVLNGGLVLAPLGACQAVPEPEPPYPDDYAAAQAYFQKLYGRVRPRSWPPTPSQPKDHPAAAVLSRAEELVAARRPTTDPTRN